MSAPINRRLRLAALLASGIALVHAPACRATEWTALETEHFAILSQVSEGRSREIIRRLHIYMQALPKLTNLPVRPASVLTQVFLLDKPSFERTRVGSPRLSGYFLPGTFRNVIVVDASMDLTTSLQIVQHEYVHFAIQNARLSSLPAFYEEGFAQFMESFTFRGHRFNWGYFPPGYRTIAKSDAMPLLQVLAVEVGKGDYLNEDRRKPFYARALLLMHYCNIGATDCREPFQRMAGRIADGDSPAEAFDGEFGIAPDELDASLDEYLAGKAESRYLWAPASELDRDPGIRSRPLAPGEADVRFAFLLLKTVPQDAGIPDLFAPHAAEGPLRDLATAGLGATYGQRGQWSEADAQFDRLAAMPDATVAALLRAGDSLFDRIQADDFDPSLLGNTLRRAASYYDAALDKDPLSLEAAFGRGIIEIYLQDDLMSTARLLNEAYPRSSDNADIAMLLALHLDALGDERNARMIMRSAACGSVSPRMRHLAEVKLGAVRCYPAIQAEGDQSPGSRR